MEVNFLKQVLYEKDKEIQTLNFQNQGEKKSKGSLENQIQELKDKYNESKREYGVLEKNFISEKRNNQQLAE